jgi:dockerin type I repeat protein
MAASGNNVYVAWLNNTLGNSDILFRASHDNGTSFGHVINISMNPTGDSINPQITAAGNYAYVVWQENNSTVTTNQIYFRASPDSGISFNSIVDVSRNSAESTVPQIAAVSNNVTVVWQTSSTTHNDPFDIDYKISTQNGADLGSVTVKNLSNSNTGQSLFPQIAISGKNVYVTWRDNFPGNFRTFFCHSSNAGTSFTSPIDLSRGFVTGETDLYQQIAAAGGNVYVAWTNDTTITGPPLISNDTTVITSSTASGSSFNTPIRLSNIADVSFNPYLSTSGSDVYAVWTDSPPGQNSQIFYRRSVTNGASFNSTINLSNDAGPSKEPSIAAIGSNVYAAWDNATSGIDEITFVSSNDNGKTFGTTQVLSNRNDPSTVPEVAGAGTNAYVAWEDDAVGNGDIFFAGTVPVVTVPIVTVTALNVSRTFAYSGVTTNNITVSVNATNIGTVSASFVVSVKANSTKANVNVFIGNNQTVSSLIPGKSQVVQFSWNPASLSIGNYSITAYASAVAGGTNLLVCPSAATGCKWVGPFTSKLKGDVNGDCKVDIADLSLVGGAFGKTIGQPGYKPAADLNNDGTINIADLVNVASNFGQQVMPCPY